LVIAVSFVKILIVAVFNRIYQNKPFFSSPFFLTPFLPYNYAIFCLKVMPLFNHFILFLRRSIMRLLTLTAVTLALILSACGGSKQAVPPRDESGMPAFVLNPPVVAGKLYGTGIAKKQSPQLAKDIADLNAKTEVAKILGQKIGNLTKQFMQESGITSPEVTEFSQSVTRSITDQNLVGCVIVKREFVNETMYSLAELNLADPTVKDFIKTQVTNSLTSKEALLSEFRAKQGFESLDKELDKLQN